MNPDSPLFRAATTAIYLFLLLPILVVAVVLFLVLLGYVAFLLARWLFSMF